MSNATVWGPPVRRGGPTVMSGGRHRSPSGADPEPRKDRPAVLPRTRRVTSPADFRRVMRRGRRSGRRTLAVHAHRGEAIGPARAGLVVGRAVGGAVVRHRVSRRLRHLLAPRLAAMPAGTDVVVRAQPPAGDATSAQLAVDLDAALRRLDLVDRTV